MMSTREVLSTHVYGRLGLSEDLNSLPEPQFEQLIFALHLPQGIIPPTTAPQGQRTSALLTWAESLQGPGLHEVKNTLNQILGRSISEIEGICPYKGLSFFDFNDQDARHFHGRVELNSPVLWQLLELRAVENLRFCAQGFSISSINRVTQRSVF